MSNLVHNEQTKMLASAFNNLGVISLATGLIAPLISAFLIPPSATPFDIDGRKEFIHVPINTLGAVALGSICFVLFLSMAQFMLTQLKEEERSYPPIEKVYPQP
jgi:hypothetical protein